jgi:hypothetical protein
MSSKGRSGIELRAGAADAGRCGRGLLRPRRNSHAVRNVRGGNASELATYVVGKGKPLVIVEAGAVGRRDYRLRRLAAGIPESLARFDQKASLRRGDPLPTQRD